MKKKKPSFVSFLLSKFHASLFPLHHLSLSSSQKAIETHTLREREDKICIIGFELLLLISMALVPNLVGTHTNSLSLSLSIFDILYYFPRLTDFGFWDILSGHTAVNIRKSKVVVFGLLEWFLVLFLN